MVEAYAIYSHEVVMVSTAPLFSTLLGQNITVYEPMLHISRPLEFSLLNVQSQDSLALRQTFRKLRESKS